MTFAAVKLASRRAVHKHMAVPCLYIRPDDIGTPAEATDAVPLTARLHDRIKLSGDDGNTGYSNILASVLMVVFNREELATAAVTPASGGKVRFTDYNSTGADLSLLLDNRYPYDGPITEKWGAGPAP